MQALAVFCTPGAGPNDGVPGFDELEVCALYQTSEPLASSDAPARFGFLQRQLDRELGTGERSANSITWASTNQRVELVMEREQEGTSVSVIRTNPSAVEAMGELPPPAFPERIAGFAFGQSEGEARARCNAIGGVFIDSNALVALGNESSFACGEPKVDLPFDVQNIAGVFCDGRVCEIWVGLREPPARALQLLRDKYGAPIVTTDTAGKCKRPGMRYGWQWGAPGAVFGRLRLVDDCGLTLYYDNEAGVELRDRELRERGQNY